MRNVVLGVLCGGLTLMSQTAWSETTKLTWDGFGSGRNAKCGVYAMHINVLVDSGRVHGDWQQKGRTVRHFDFPLGADGSFMGKVDISTGTIQVKGSVQPGGGTISLHGYCDFGGPLKQG